MMPGTTLEEALAGAGDGATVIGEDGRVTFWNATAEKIFGLTSGEVLGRPCYEVFAGHDDHDAAICSSTCRILSCARQREPVASFDMRTRTKRARPLRINVSVLASQDQGETQVIHLFRDVTATKMSSILERRPSLSRIVTIAGAPLLSRREVEVLGLLGEGLSNAAIAERLGVRRGTIRNHLRSVFTKLGVHSRLEAVVFASGGPRNGPPHPPRSAPRRSRRRS